MDFIDLSMVPILFFTKISSLEIIRLFLLSVNVHELDPCAALIGSQRLKIS